MTEHTPTIDDAGTIAIDVPTLLRTKLLLTASSGGGKSWGVRRILEQTFGAAQHIVLDHDGEFHTLRERFDYGLLGDGGEGAVTAESAGMAARRLLELGVSAIVDLSSLRGAKDTWVKGFCTELMDAPRSLWHPLIVVLDEAHKYAPEVGMDDAASTQAIKDLATDGRKRAFCLVACTQRVAALHKGVVAELHNKMIGLTTMDIDVQRAARQLGMKPSRAVEALSFLNPGEFHVVGPALCRRVELVKVGSVVTTHPEPGAAPVPPTPPRATIKKVLGQLAEIAPAAKEEVKTVEQLKARVRELEDRERAYSLEYGNTHAQELAARTHERDAALLRARDAERFLRVQENVAAKMIDRIDRVITDLTETRNEWVNAIEDEVEAERAGISLPEALDRQMDVTPTHPSNAREMAEAVSPMGGEYIRRYEDRYDGIFRAPIGLSKIEHAFLLVLAQRGPQPQKRILIYSGYARSGNTDKAFAAIVAKGYASRDGDKLVLTAAGADAIAPVPMLTTRALPIDEMPKAFLLVLAQAGPLTQRTTLLLARYARSGNTDKAFALLSKNEWIVKADGALAITPFGRESLGPYEKVTKQYLREVAAEKLDTIERRFWAEIVTWAPEPIDRKLVLEKSGYKRSGNTDKAFAFLVSRGWVTKVGNKITASPELF